MLFDTDTVGPAAKRVVLKAPLTGREKLWAAVSDLRGGLANWELWGLLGWYDILARYRRSVLGPLWLTISMAVLIGSLGFLYASLFRLSTSEYIPYLASGFLLWTFISTVFNEGCQVFVQAEGVIKQVRVPYSVHIYRLVWRNVIILGHNAVVFVGVAIIFSIPIGWELLSALPGLVIFVINGIWVSIIFGIISARFRDVAPIVGSILQIAFFLTPIIWKPEILEGRAAYLELNPFWHVLETVRAPLLGQTVSGIHWMVASSVTAVGCILALWTFAQCRNRIAFWL